MQVYLIKRVLTLHNYIVLGLERNRDEHVSYYKLRQTFSCKKEQIRLHIQVEIHTACLLELLHSASSTASYSYTLAGKDMDNIDNCDGPRWAENIRDIKL